MHRTAPLIAMALALIALPTASADTPIIYDDTQLFTDNSTLDLHEDATLQVLEVRPGVGLRLRLHWNDSTEDANVVEGSNYTFEVEEEPYVEVSEIETRSGGSTNYSFARVRQHLGYDLAIRNCTAAQTQEEYVVSFTTSNRGFRWTTADVTLRAGGETETKTITVGGGATRRTRVSMDWNLTEEGPIDEFTLSAEAPEEKNSGDNICTGTTAKGTPLPTPTGTPVGTATPTPGITATETPAGTPTATPGATSTETPTPTGTATPLHPVLPLAALGAAALARRRTTR